MRQSTCRAHAWGMVLLVALCLLTSPSQSATKTGLMQEDAGIVNALKYAATPTSRNTATLVAAVAALGATPRTLMLSAGAWTLTANLTMPPTLTLWVPQGSTLDIDSGHTLTHQGPLKVDGCNHFTGAGTILLPAIAELNVCWFGATGQLDVDDTAAFQRAARSLNTIPTGGHTTGLGCCAPIFRIPAGSFKLTAPIQFAHAVSIRGNGPANTFLVAFNLAGNTLETNGGVVGIPARFAVEDLTFIGATPKSAGAALFASTPNPTDAFQIQLRVNNINCLHHYTCINLDNSVVATITNNNFAEVAGTAIIINTSSNYDAGDNLVAHNAIATGPTGQVGIQAGTSGQRIIGNKFVGFQFGIVVAPTTPVAISDVLIANNSVEIQVQYGILIHTPTASSEVHNVHIVNNQVGILQGTTVGNALIACTGQIGGLVIDGNVGTYAGANQTGILIGANARGESPTAFTVNNNNLAGSNAAGSVGILLPALATAQGTVSNNWLTSLATHYTNHGALIMGGTAQAFAGLSGMGSPGSMVYCSDCQVASGANNACIAGGTGAMAMQINNTWRCFNAQN